MKTIDKILLIVLLIVTSIAGVEAQEVISGDQLVKMMRDPNILIISTRKPENYAKVHVLGAVNVIFSELNGDMAMLLPVDEIAQILGDKGISNSNNIVIYDKGSGTAAGRMYWTLKYLGAENVKILDGGMPVWLKARKPVSVTIPNLPSVEFKVNLHSEYLATMQEVQSAIKSNDFILVDARSSSEYDGSRADKSLKRTGHIPTAVNINYVNVFDEDGLLKPKEELVALFNKNGVTNDKKVIIYCKSSVRAAVIFHVLADRLDYPNVKVYDGAYLEWQQNFTNKVVK